MLLVRAVNLREAGLTGAMLELYAAMMGVDPAYGGTRIHTSWQADTQNCNMPYVVRRIQKWCHTDILVLQR